MSDTSAAQLNLEAILVARLEITQQERVAIKESLDALDIKVKNLVTRIGAKPRETLESTNEMMRSLEHSHATTTQSKSDERQFMREVDKLKQKKKQIIDYLKSNEELDVYKEKRAALYQDLRDKDKTLDELSYGIRKIRTATKLQCSTAEVVEQRFNFPEDSLPRIIGKGGQNLRALETEHKVSIEAERTGGFIRIMGTEKSISNAYGNIMNTVNTSSVEINPADETIVCLVLNKAAYVHDLQTRHSVRIDVSRAKKVCKITGLANAIAAAVVEINLIDSCRYEIGIDNSLLPSIVGKGGIVIRTLEEEHRVQIDVLREENKVVILGFRTDVEMASQTLRNIIVENKEVEESIKANRHVIITCIIGNGGQTARALQKDLGVGIRVDRAVDENNNSSSDTNNNNGSNDLDTIKLRGTTTKVLHAKAHLLQLLKDFYSHTYRVEVPADCLPLIVGKKGSRINSLREEYPDASIDIEGSIVYIQSTNEASRIALKSIIENLVSSNYIKTVEMIPDIAISLKGQRGSDLRTLFTSTLELGFEIDGDSKSIKLRGKQENVLMGIAALDQFRDENYSDDLVCTSDDCLALMTPLPHSNNSSSNNVSSNSNINNTNNSNNNSNNNKTTNDTTNDTNSSNNSSSSQAELPYKLIEKEFNVDIYISRKDNTLKIRGTQINVNNAKSAMQSLLDGDLSRGSLVMPINKIAFSALIGKGGATLKKIEADNKIKLDLLKSKSLIRIRGNSTECILAAKVYIKTFLDEIKSTSSIEYQHTNTTTPSSSSSATSISSSLSSSHTVDDTLLINTSVETTQESFGVEVTVAKSSHSTSSTSTSNTTSNSTTHGNAKSNSTSNSNTNATTSTLTIKGLIRLVDAAHDYLHHRLSKPPFTTIQTTQSQSHQLKSQPFITNSLNEIATKYQTDIQIINNNNSSNNSSHSNNNDNAENNQSSLIRIQGSDYSKIQEARRSVIQLLQTCFPSEYIALPVTLYFLQDLTSHCLDEELENTEVDFEFDIPLRIVLLCSEVNQVQNQAQYSSILQAVDLLKKKQIIWNELHPIIPMDDYLLPSFVGKNGSAIVALEKETKVRIRVNRIEKRLEIEGNNDKNIVAKAYETVAAKVEKMRASHWEVVMNPELLGTFIGKDGNNIKKFRTDTNANIDVDNKTEVLRVTGDPACVVDAKERILLFIKEEEKNNCLVEVVVPVASYPVIIGTKGSIAKDIQTKTGCRLELDRNRQTVILRGSSESCEKASILIQSILTEHGLAVKPAATSVVESVTADADGSSNSDQAANKPIIKICPGAPPSLASKQQITTAAGVNMSKSALRRLKRKQTTTTTATNTATGTTNNNSNGKDEEEEDDDEDDESNSEDIAQKVTVITTPSSVVSPSIQSTTSQLPIGTRAISQPITSNIPGASIVPNIATTALGSVSTVGPSTVLAPPTATASTHMNTTSIHQQQQQQQQHVETFSMDDLLIPGFGPSTTDVFNFSAFHSSMPPLTSIPSLSRSTSNNINGNINNTININNTNSNTMGVSSSNGLNSSNDIAFTNMLQSLNMNGNSNGNGHSVIGSNRAVQSIHMAPIGSNSSSNTTNNTNNYNSNAFAPVATVPSPVVNVVNSSSNGSNNNADNNTGKYFKSKSGFSVRL